MGGRKTAVIL